ncbi:ubiquitin carboxyl-terminal hydrolase CYLD-like [Pocillopora verrucosa]|uniref:ubiquitin carboxyl-terminal hydrolase CYLD-like n=1 Tax=Pocillopora verrucosa TaxID=203993 RepID=UPI00333FFEB1
MEDPSIKYILLRDCVRRVREKTMLSLGVTTKSTPIQILRGEILEDVPEAEQPTDSTEVAVVGINCKSLRLECPTENVTRLSEEETNLLLAITSSEGRYLSYIDRKRMAFGRQLSQGSAVFVDVKGNSKFLPGIVRYKGVLPPIPGTWFGVELINHPGLGTCNGTLGNKRYFTCEPDCGIFVGLDKLRPREDGGDLKS